MERVTTLLAENKGGLCGTMHTIVTNGAIVVRAGNALVFAGSSARICWSCRLARGACISIADMGVSHGVGSQWCFREYLLELACKQGSETRFPSVASKMKEGDLKRTSGTKSLTVGKLGALSHIEIG